MGQSKSNSKAFGEWLCGEIARLLNRQVSATVLILWCDPDGEWFELLQAAASDGSFELWANPDEHELLLRDRFYRAESAPRVIWLPCAREEITWFKVFEIRADVIWEKSLLEALREYGVSIPRDQEKEISSLLPAHAKEWFDKPKETWKELTPGSAKGTLVDDHRMLEILAGEESEFDRLREEKRFSIFARRAVEDFGFPDPTEHDEKSWRVSATARLLCTEAAEHNPQEPPSEQDKIIAQGLPRDRALKLLKSWQENIHFIPAFEKTVLQAEATIGLTYWARNLDTPPMSFSSWAVEEALFKRYAEELDRIENAETLAEELGKCAPVFMERESGFWGRHATQKVGWHYLVQLAQVASLLLENANVEKGWKTAAEAIEWYHSSGWRIDHTGEMLFEETPDLPAQLHRIRARLRRGYQRATDHVGAAFSELLAHDSDQLSSMSTAGEILLSELERSKTRTALVFLDACRLDLGHRLADLLNEGEPAQRAEVRAALAPVPTITPMGMSFALPMKRDMLNVSMAKDGKSFQVTAEGFDGDLAKAEQRREWMTKHFGVKTFLTIADVLDSDKLKVKGRPPRLMIVAGTDFDDEGHEGRLKLTGADEHLERYAQAIRKLREAGYSRVIIATDHGFFHWQPMKDEIEQTKPSGDILWLSRRAIVGRELSHSSALHLKVPQSDLEAAVPRSVNAFKTYGQLGYFHGGASLQELIIPVVIAQWPAKAKKVGVVLKPVGHITSETPRVNVESGLSDVTLFGVDEKVLARRVIVKVQEPSTGKLVFRHEEPVIIEPGGEPITIQLNLVEPRPVLPYGSPLVAVVVDADDEEILSREEVELKVDIDEW